ncbi:MAG: hypothetical protein KBS70_09170 [Bacteroidales bacterium]|nr:hypothetical protein [Candidatus Colicola equi]
MKKQFILGLLATIISLPVFAGGSSKVDYKTPSEKYAKWCSAFELNRVWEFNDKGSATNGSNPNGNTSLKETPDMLSFALMTWNDRQDSSDDYRLNWAKIYLTSDKPGNSTIHVCTIQFCSHSGLYDSGSSFSWIFNNFNEGKVSSIESANGKTVCVQRRGLNSHSWDASIFCYFVTEYNEALRKFVNENMGHIKLRIHCSWYGREWRENDETSGLLPSHIMVPITKPTLNNVYWDVEGDKTVTRYHLDPTDSSYETRLEVKAGGSHEIQAYTSTTAGDYAMAWKDYSWFKRELLNGHLQFIAQNQKKYPISKKNWDEQYGTLSTTTYMNSDVTAVTIPTMVQPTNFGVEDKGTGVLTLNWSTPNGSYEIEDNCGFVVDRSLDSTFKEGVTTYNVTYGSSPYKQEDAFKERGLGKKPFYYRLYRAKTSPKDMALVEKVTVNTDYRGIQDFSVSAQGSQALVKWTLDDNGIWNDQTMCVRLESNKTSPQTFRLDKNSTTVPLTTCDPTNFRLSVQENGVEVSCRTLNDFVLPDETPSAISNLSISKGFYNDHVSIAWKVPQDSSNFHTFEVLREPLNNQSEQTPLGTVDFKLGVYNYSFQDQTAVPGVYYIYTVRGQSACGDKIRNVAVASGIGFAQPYGVVAGQVAFEGNQGVPDVQVRAEGESVFKSRSLFFTPLFKSESIESTDSTTWSRTISNPFKDHKSGTFEIWLRSSGSGYQEIFYGKDESSNKVVDIDAVCDVHKIRIIALCTTNQNIINSREFTVSSLANKYTHFAFTYDCRANAIDVNIYIDGILQTQTSAPVGTNEVLKLTTATELNIGAMRNSWLWKGPIDEIRFWDGVRTDAEIAEWANKQLTADKQSDPSLLYYYKKQPIRYTTNTAMPAYAQSVRSDYFQPKQGSIELWIKPELSERPMPIIYQNNSILWQITDGNKLQFSIYPLNKSNSSPYTIEKNINDSNSYWQPNTFNHIAVSFRPLLSTQLEATLFINGHPVKTQQFTVSAEDVFAQSTEPLLLGSNTSRVTTDGSAMSYNGFMDEIRFWNIYRDSTAIARTMNGYLNGSESGLTGYYRCDDDIAGELYDLSKASSAFNERHMTTSLIRTDENNVPNPDQLALCTYTDSLGNYLLNAVPYGSNGTTYRIIPSLGIHKFSPSNKPIFFDSHASTHNSIDFRDESSFPVSGYVYYENTDYPVAGCNFYVDGTMCTKNNKMIESAADGSFTINVPIGAHSITIKKEGHSFANGGRFPVDPDSVETTYNFDRELNGIDFTDITKVKLTGRVAGGSDQAKLAHGMQLGKNNIGQARINISPVEKNKYNLNLTDTTRLWAVPDSMTVKSVATTRPKEGSHAMYITVVTDPQTGEFTALLPPVDMTVDSISIPSDESKVFNTASFAKMELSQCVDAKLTTDSVMIDSVMHYFQYTAKLDAIYRVKPKLDIHDQNRQDSLFGITNYEIVDLAHDTSYVVPIIATDSVTRKSSYVWGRPFFLQGNTYAVAIHCYEPYTNYDRADSVVTDQVPVGKSTVTINNQLGNRIIFDRDTSFIDSQTGDTIRYHAGSVVSGTNKFQLDSTGRGIYVFTAGDPLTVVGTDSANNFVLYASANYTNTENTETYDWDMNGKANGIVLGQVSIDGTNFMIAGPSEVMFVLRNPPGSHSTATWSKGTSFTTTIREQNHIKHYGGGTITAHFGACITTGVGIGVMTFTALEAKDKFTHTEKGGNMFVDDKTTTYRITSKTDISTKDDLFYVGSWGDVFVGVSTDFTFGAVKELAFRRRDDGSFYLDVKRSTAVGRQYSTDFALSQRDIIDTEIPTFEKNRNDLIEIVSPATYETDTINKSQAYRYTTILAKTDPKFGTEGTYKAIAPQSLTIQTGVAQNMVQYYNNQIDIWKSVLANNEKAKVQAIQDRKKVQNISVDGGVVRTYIATTDTGSCNSNGTIHYYDMACENEFGGLICKVGVTSTQLYSLNKEWGKITDTEDVKETELRYTFEQNTYEKLSVDVFTDSDPYGPIFATVAGQTMCPYEGEEKTKYYEPGQHILNVATQAMEMPQIQVTSSSIVQEVPVGGRAEYQVQLANTSDVDGWTMMRLRLMEPSNPDGAVLKVDGMPLTGEGRVMKCTVGTPINKTITLEQGRQSVLQYDNIGIIFSSDCAENFSADTAYITAGFVASCPPVTLKSDRLVTNLDQGTDVRLTVSGIDINLSTFKKLRLEYKRLSDVNWQQIIEVPKADLKSASYSHTWAMAALNDGEYEVRAVTVCEFGSEEKPNETEPIVITKDTSAPVSLGRPSPINGILTADNEVYVTFNEPIQPGLLKSSNVAVTGVLNERPIQHDVAYRMSPEQNLPTLTDAKYDISGQDFAFACWVYIEKDGVLFAHNNDGLMVVIRDEGLLSVNINQNGEMDVVTSEQALPKNKWMYLAVIVQRTDTDRSTLNCYAAYDATTVHLISNYSMVNYSQCGQVGLGISYGDMAQGAIHDLQLWKGSVSWPKLQSSMYVTKELFTDDLYGYWPMNEGEGRVLHDKMRNRHMLAPGASWYYGDPNYAVRVPKGTKASINISDRSMNDMLDYALEFWFRTTDNGVLLSSNAKDSIQIGLKNDQIYVVTNYGTIYHNLDRNYTDGQWHHFAILVHRLEDTQVLIDDVTLVLKTYDIVNDLNGSRMYIGNDSSVVDIDEIRFWNASITSEWIRDNHRARLTGAEPGLMTYIPMEKRSVEQGIEKYNFDLSDFSTLPNYDHSLGLMSETDSVALIPLTDAPAMKADKHAVNVKHSYVASDTKIVISINEEPALIEGTTLNFSVRDVVDKCGNYSPEIKWTAFVNRNRLVWQEDHISVEKEMLGTKQMQVTFSNLSGETENWSLINLPSYLTANQIAGSLRPQQSITLTLTIGADLAIGHYDPIIYLVGNEGIKTPLNIDIHVTGDKPDWTIRQEDYEYTMNLIGAVWTTILEPDTADMMAAFINGQVAGVCHPQTITAGGTNYILMDIYANLSQKEQDSINHNLPIHKQVTFRYWDASSGVVYSQVEVFYRSALLQINYQPNAMIGSFDEPVSFDLGYAVEQTICLQKGWNWTSYNVISGEKNIETALAELLPYISIMKSQEAFVKVDSVRHALSGNLQVVDAYKAYKTLATNSTTQHIEGLVLDPATIEIPIKKGWNWIGYVPQITLSVSMALSNMEPAEGDIIKARSGFAVWHNNAWVGSLAAVTPGQGYMYFNNTSVSKTFSYPSYIATTIRTPQRLLAIENTDYHYSPISPSTYSGNMTMTAIVMDGVEQVTTAEVAFFAGEECRTTMKASKDDHYYFTIPGDETVVLHPRVWYNNEEYRPNQTFNFIEDADYGTFDEPIVIQLNPTTDLSTSTSTSTLSKFIKDNQLLIRKNGKTYNAVGIEL